ncbi:hypothetical protein ACJZ2D_015113 [Fusarium nematophilum]
MTDTPNPPGSAAPSDEATLQWSASKALEQLDIGSLKETPHQSLLFFHLMGQLKRVTRAGWKRYPISGIESVSDHSWRMSVLALCLPPDLNVDFARVSQMTIVHDIGEVLVGDITPHDPIPRLEKRRREEETVKLFASMLGEQHGKYILDLFMEFEEQETKESQVANDLDNIEMLLQAVEYEQAAGCALDEFVYSGSEIVTAELKDWVTGILQQREVGLRKD